MAPQYYTRAHHPRYYPFLRSIISDVPASFVFQGWLAGLPEPLRSVVSSSLLFPLLGLVISLPVAALGLLGRQVWHRLDDLLYTHVIVRGGSPAFDWLAAWLAQHKVGSFERALDMSESLDEGFCFDLSLTLTVPPST